MIFTGLEFWIFFLVIFPLFAILYKKSTARNAYLALVSFYFYYKTSGTFIILLLFTILLGFYAGKYISKSDDKKRRQFILGVSVALLLFFLFFFKYAYLFVDTVNALAGTNWQVHNFFADWGNMLWPSGGFNPDVIILPVGISFFTFQIITYVGDIYRNQLKPIDSLSDFAFYVSFFPQLVAGPIVRASEFLPQLKNTSPITKAQFSFAVYMILKGLFKKLFIGDYMAVNFIDRVFDNPMMYTGTENLVALFAYSLQVYVDFSGYTDIAIGLSQLMGFKLSPNFNSPYKAINVSDFWRRWHISLSGFLRDYLYIPLGGNRKSEGRTQLNLITTMLLGGLWHGASWNFVIWGGLNGAGLMVYKFWKKISPYEKLTQWYIRPWKIFVTFSFITFTRVFFRSPNMETVRLWANQVLHNFSISVLPEFMVGFYKVWLVMALGFLLHWLPNSFKDKLLNYFSNSPVWWQALMSAVIILIIYQSLSSEMQPFIYFQF